MDGVVVLGASGMLGTALVRVLESRGTAHVAAGRDRLDLEDDGIEPALEALSPSAVINAAAYTDVARAEQEGERRRAYRLNRDAPGALAHACRALGVPLIHVSTDYVFDGRKEAAYVETDAVGPLQIYGRSKLEGERRVLAGHHGALIVRTSTLYGPGRADRPHYVDAILRQARRSDRLHVVRLPVSSPTYSIDLARGLIELLESSATGIVHLVNRGGCSRLELAREILRRAGLDRSTELRERSPPAGPPARPAFSVLDTSRFAQLTGREPRTWQEALADYLGTSP
jgi:dTDP-4-dehydrorhamnose reductase